MPPSLATWKAGLPLSPSGVPYAESARQNEPSPVEEIRPDGCRAVVLVDCPWDQRQKLEKDWLEWAIVINATQAGANRYISRNVPRAYPGRTSNIASRPYLYAKDIMRWVGQAPPDTTAGQPGRTGSTQIPTPWMLARGTWVYEDRSYAADAAGIYNDATMIAGGFIDANGNPDEATLQRYITKVTYPGGQALPLPVQSFKYVDGSATQVPGQPTVRDPNYRWEITWHQVPLLAVPIALINDLSLGTYTNGLLAADLALGCVNSANFPAKAKNPRAPGTLLLESIKPIPKISALGDRIYDITYVIAVYNPPGHLGTGLDDNNVPIGHNHLIQKVPGSNAVKWREVSSDGSSNYQSGSPNGYKQNGTRQSPYLGVDFNTLFRVP